MTSVITLSVVVRETLPPVPSPKISYITVDSRSPNPLPPFSIYTAFIWLLLLLEFPPSLIIWISESVVVSQLFGTTKYSVESNLMTSEGETVNRYFHLYLSEYPTGSTSVCVGFIVDVGTVGLRPEEPFSIQI